MVLHSVSICLALSGARHDLGIRDKTVVRGMSMSYQASELLVENVRDLSVRLLMLNYLYNIKCQDTTIETQHSCVHLSLLTSLSLRLLTQGNGNSWSLQGLLRHYHGCVWSSSDC